MVKKLLFVTTHYAPLNGTGIWRGLKFTEYLAELGWEVHVLRSTHYLKTLYRVQTTPIPAHIMIHTAPHISAFELMVAVLERFGLTQNHILPPDKFRLWEPFATRAGLKIVAEHGIHAVMSTSPYFTAGLVAANIARQTNLPFVFDTRDPWINRAVGGFPSRWHRQYNQHLEKQVVKEASVITASAKLMYDYYEKVFPDKPLHLIPNGFDLKEIPPATTISLQPRLHMVFTGNFYHHSNNQHPDVLFSVLQNLIASGELARTHIQLTFMGNAKAVVKSLAAQHHLEDLVECLPLAPHHEAIQLMLQADALFMVERSEATSNKFYEYLATGLPALIMSRSEEAHRIIDQYTDNSYFLDPEDAMGIRQALLDIYQHKKLNSQLERYRAAYNRQATTQTLAGLLDKLIENAPLS